ncbi:MAG: Bug family tripartite tricarboxylate transporter substrate binding protein [Alphaproteobacteria bacterium]
MKIRTLLTGIAAASLLSASLSAPAIADAVSDFYNGRAVTVLVPSGSGGLNALYARTVGDHLGKHIPGNPKVIYQYMPGGGGLKGTNYCYTAAPKDGSMICEPLNPFPLMQMLRPKGVKYDAANFNYIGNASDMNGSFAVLGSVPVKKLMDAKNREVIYSGTGKGSESYYDPTIVNSLFGTKFKLVMGYKGGGALDLSLERGESQGRAGPLLSWVVRKPEWLKSGRIRILTQVGMRKFAGFEDVPLLTEFARNEDEKQILTLISSRAAIGRPFVAPPGVPADRVAALRKAFVDTMNDPAFQADVKKRRLLNMWSTGEAVEAVVKKMLATPKPLIERTRAVLGYPS